MFRYTGMGFLQCGCCWHVASPFYFGGFYYCFFVSFHFGIIVIIVIIVMFGILLLRVHSIG